MKDFVIGDVRQSWKLYFMQRVYRFSIRAHRFDFSPCATRQGVNSTKEAPASMYKIWVHLWASDFQYFCRVGIDFRKDFSSELVPEISSSFQCLRTVVKQNF